MRLYGKKNIRRLVDKRTKRRQEIRDAILWEIDGEKCRIKIQGSNTMVVAHFPRNQKKAPSWLRAGNAVKVVHKEGIRGYIEVIGEGRCIPTAVSGGSLPETGDLSDGIISGLVVTVRDSTSFKISEGTYRYNGSVYASSGTDNAYYTMSGSVPFVMGDTVPGAITYAEDYTYTGAYEALPGNYKNEYNPDTIEGYPESGTYTLEMNINYPGKDLFRVYVPKGATEVSFKLYVSQDAKIGVAARMGQEPQCLYDVVPSEYYGLPWGSYSGTSLTALDGQDFQARNQGDQIVILSSATVPANHAGQWIYIKLLKYDANDSYITYFDVCVDAVEYKNWYKNEAVWDAQNNPIGIAGTIGGTCDPAWGEGEGGEGGINPETATEIPIYMNSEQNSVNASSIPPYGYARYDIIYIDGATGVFNIVQGVHVLITQLGCDGPEMPNLPVGAIQLAYILLVGNHKDMSNADLYKIWEDPYYCYFEWTWGQGRIDEDPDNPLVDAIVVTCWSQYNAPLYGDVEFAVAISYADIWAPDDRLPRGLLSSKTGTVGYHPQTGKVITNWTTRSIEDNPMKWLILPFRYHISVPDQGLPEFDSVIKISMRRIARDAPNDIPGSSTNYIETIMWSDFEYERLPLGGDTDLMGKIWID